MSEDAYATKETIVSGAVVAGLMVYSAVLTWLVSTTTSNMLMVMLYLLVFAFCSIFGGFLVIYKWDLETGWSFLAPAGMVLISGVPILLVMRLFTKDMFQICLWPLIIFLVSWYLVTKLVKDDAITEYRRHREATAPLRARKKAEKERRKVAKEAAKTEKDQAEKERLGKAAKADGQERHRGAKGKPEEKPTKQAATSKFKKWLDEGEEKKDGPEGQDAGKAVDDVGKPEGETAGTPEKGAISKFSAWLNEEDKKKEE